MAHISIEIPDSVLDKLQRDAARREVTVEQLIEKDTINRLGRAPEEWMPKSQWEARIKGEECALCDDLRPKLVDMHFGRRIAVLETSTWYLSKNQFVPGYSILVLNRHACEPYALPLEERNGYFNDLMKAAKALETVLHSVKMNFEIQGNGTPHLHTHLKPRFYGDLAPGWPIDPNAQVVNLSDAERNERITLLNNALLDLS